MGFGYQRKNLPDPISLFFISPSVALRLILAIDMAFLKPLNGFLHIYAKTKLQISCPVTAQLISAFFSTWTVQFLFFLNLKFQASSNLLWLHRQVCVGPQVRYPQDWFSRFMAQMSLDKKKSCLLVFDQDCWYSGCATRSLK